MTRLHDLHAQGQSPWMDYIRRDLTTSGELQSWIERGVRGVTSNPTLFEHAIAKSDLYTADIHRLAKEGKSTDDIYEALAFADIRAACDIFLPLFRESGGGDGFVSLEVPPAISDDSDATIAEGKRLWQEIGRPNLMVKVPATAPGLTAFTELIAAGVNVNVTLMFTHQDYVDVAEAYMRGLEKRLAQGADLAAVRSVASVFVSRIDGAVEALLSGEARERLLGRPAIANTRLIYRTFKQLFDSERFARLRAVGARPQRPLWASTGTKNPQLSPVLYVDHLIGPDTVNTMPPQTLQAFLDQGAVKRTVDATYAADEDTLRACRDAGVDLDAVGRELKQKGLKSFADSFDSLMQTIDKERLVGVQA